MFIREMGEWFDVLIKYVFDKYYSRKLAFSALVLVIG